MTIINFQLLLFLKAVSSGNSIVYLNTHEDSTASVSIKLTFEKFSYKNIWARDF